MKNAQRLRKRGKIRKEYVKPTIIPTTGLGEGVYMASGAGPCLSITSTIEYTPDMEFSGGHYSIRLEGTHNADHYSHKQRATITFNQSVTFYEQQGGGVCVGSQSGTVLVLEWDLSGYGIGPKNDTHGYGYLKVDSEPGLQVLSIEAEDIAFGDNRKA